MYLATETGSLLSLVTLISKNRFRIREIRLSRINANFIKLPSLESLFRCTMQLRRRLILQLDVCYTRIYNIRVNREQALVERAHHQEKTTIEKKKKKRKKHREMLMEERREVERSGEEERGRRKGNETSEPEGRDGHREREREKRRRGGADRETF